MSDRRQSKKRDAILNLMRSTRSHPEAQWVYDRLKPEFPDLSLGTVYRNIKVLLEEGALASAGVIMGEEHFDGEPVPHPHVICRHCGKIMDLPKKAEEEIFSSISINLPGFTIDIRSTVFYGLCNGCITKE